MFLPTKLHEGIIDINKNRYTLRVGNCVPDNAINLAYFYNKKILPDSSLLVSEAPKNIIDHKVVGQWMTKRSLATISDIYFPVSIPYHDEDGYSGQLQEKFIDWTTNTHIEKETNTSLGTVNDLSSKFALLIDRTNFTDNLYAGLEYLMAVTWTVFGTTNMLKPNTISKECVWELTVDNQSSPSYSFPSIYQYNGNGYSGTLNQNGAVIIDKEFTAGELIPGAPISIPFPVTSEPNVGDTRIDPSTGATLTYRPGSYTTNSVTGAPTVTEYHSYGISNYNGDENGYWLSDTECGNWSDPYPSLMASLYDRQCDILRDAVFHDDPQTGRRYVDYSSTTTGGTTKTTASTYYYDVDASDHFAGTTGTGGMLWLHTYYNNYTLPVGTYTDWDGLKDYNNNNLLGSSGDPIHPSDSSTVKYTIAFYKWSSTVTITTTNPTAIFEGQSDDSYGNAGLTYKLTQRYHNKLTKDASYMSPVPTQWSARINYKGVLKYTWLDYDGAGFYEGTVVKHSAIGNGNPVGSNQLLMYPDSSGILYDIYNKPKIESEEFEITNIFKDGVPLFYKCKLQYRIFDSNGPDALGMYMSNSIKLLTSSMRPLNPRKYKYAVQINPTSTVDLYDVYIYTSFLTTSSFNVLCSYNAYNDAPGLSTLDRLMPSTIEKIEVQPFYIKGVDYTVVNDDAVARMNHITITNNLILTDNRNSVKFNYTIRTADNSYVSNSIYAEIINVDYAFDSELTNYVGRNQNISPLEDGIPMTAYEVIMRDCKSKLVDVNGVYDAFKINALSKMNFIAEFKDMSDSLTLNEGLVNLFTNQNGSSIVSAETTVDTGFDDGFGGHTKKIPLPGKFKVINKKIYPAYQVMCKDARLIKVLPPREDGTLENWYPRIQFSHFSRVLSDHGMSVKNVYAMPEFDTQNYSSKYGKPYKDIIDEQTTILNERTIKIKYCPLYVVIDDNYVPVNLTVRKLDINGDYKNLVISSWNYTEGVIELIDIINENDNILVSYTYEEQSYIYRGFYDTAGDLIDLDMNPSQYHDYLDHRYLPYERRSVYELFNAIVYFFMKPSEIIQTKTYSDYLENSTNIFPDTIQATKDDYAGALTKDGDSVVVSRTGSTLQNIVYRQYYTGIATYIKSETNTLYHKFNDSIPNAKYDIMIGSVHVRQNASLKSTTIVDTRTRGGGIIKEMYDDMRKELEPESDYYWDIGYWDGKPYTENAVVNIRLDKSILKDYGGRFTTEEVESVVHKWITAGVLPIIEYVDVLPQISLDVKTKPYGLNYTPSFTPYAFATVIEE